MFNFIPFFIVEKDICDVSDLLVNTVNIVPQLDFIQQDSEPEIIEMYWEKLNVQKSNVNSNKHKKLYHCKRKGNIYI